MKIYVLKSSLQNEDGTYDYVRVVGAFFNFDDAMAEAVKCIERIKLIWPNSVVGEHNGSTIWIKSETGISKWYDVKEMVVR